MKRFTRLAFAICIALLLVRLAIGEEETTKPDGDKQQHQFVRLARDESERPLSLDTAIVRCAPIDGDDSEPTVDLVAAIHIADASYYRRLNREFSNYEAVLYEMVASEKNAAPRRGGNDSKHPVSLMQHGAKDLLELQHQLDGIDYSRKNMIHADMSPDEVARSMRKKGETVATMLARMLGHAIASQNEASGGLNNVRLLAALFDKNRALELKKLAAQQLVSNVGATAALEGPDGSTIISGRNKVALDVLKKQIGGGKKKIAIFYGAGHMPDLLERLKKDFGMVPVDTRWLTAWKLQQ